MLIEDLKSLFNASNLLPVAYSVETLRFSFEHDITGLPCSFLPFSSTVFLMVTFIFRGLMVFFSVLTRATGACAWFPI